MLETTDLPDELITKVGGNILFEHESPLVNTCHNERQHSVDFPGYSMKQTGPINWFPFFYHEHLY